MNKIKELIKKMNESGIPIPLLHDPKGPGPSVTFTMMVIAFNVVIIGLVGKWSKAIGDIDMTSAMYLFVTTSGLYLGRKMQSDSKSKSVTLDYKDDK